MHSAQTNSGAMKARELLPLSRDRIHGEGFMKWFGIGTAVMAFAIAASALTYGQERQPGVPGQEPQDSGRSAPGQPRPGSTGQPGSRDTTSQGDRNSSQRQATGQADAQGFVNDL